MGRIRIYTDEERKERQRAVEKRYYEANKERLLARANQYHEIKRCNKAPEKRSLLPKYAKFIKTENDVRHYEMLKIQCQNLRLTGSL